MTATLATETPSTRPEDILLQRSFIEEAAEKRAHFNHSEGSFADQVRTMLENAKQPLMYARLEFIAAKNAKWGVNALHHGNFGLARCFLEVAHVATEMILSKCAAEGKLVLPKAELEES